MQLPLGIVGIALGTALLPRFSQAEAAGNNAAVKTALGGAIILGGFLVIPAVTGLIILSEPILTGLFAHGAFTNRDAGMAGLALVAYAVGLPGFVLVKILQPAFYAAGRPGTVLKISAIMVAANVVGSLLLMGPYGHVGLAIATAVSGLLAAVIMLLLLATAGKFSRTILLPLVRILLATGVMAVLLWFLGPMVSDMASVLRLLIWWLQVVGHISLLPRCLARFCRSSAPPLMGASGVWGLTRDSKSDDNPSGKCKPAGDGH